MLRQELRSWNTYTQRRESRMNLSSNKIKEIYNLTLKLEQALNEFNIEISKRIQSNEQYHPDNKYAIRDFDDEINNPILFLEDGDQTLNHHKRTEIVLKTADNSKITKKDLGLLKKKMELRQIKTKTPLTPFFLFMQSKREDVRKQFPSFSPGEISKLMGTIWSHLTEEQKRPYHDSFEASKVKYKNFVEKKLAE